MNMVKATICSLLVMAVGFVPAAFADVNNPIYTGTPISPTEGDQSGGVAPYTDHDAWKAAAGATTLIDFEQFADGTPINTELSPYCITMVTGSSPNAPGAVEQYVTSSASLPFPMFTAGTLPTEPNFLSNDLNPGTYATGEITFEMANPTTAIGAYVADGSPLDGFTIEVFDGDTSLGFITVPPRTLPDSFVGIVSGVPFNKAQFIAVSEFDSWGLDNLEHNCGEPTPTETSTWGKIKTIY